jgi:hypothetical protein
MDGGGGGLSEYVKLHYILYVPRHINIGYINKLSPQHTLSPLPTYLS